MPFQRAEAHGEGLVRLVIQRLTAEHQDLVGEESTVHALEDGIGERLAEVDLADLRAEAGGLRRDGGQVGFVGGVGSD